MHKRILILFLSLATLIWAGEPGSTGLSFLKIAVDARAAAMGEAYTAVCTDAAATYWNPAGLALAGSNSIAVMHHAWLQDINHEFLSVQLFQGKHNVAVAVNLIQVSDIQLRGDQASETPIGSTSATNMYLGLNYATALGGEWSVGGQLKYVYEKYYLTYAEGVALDLGVRRKNILPRLEWGLTIQNLGTMNKLRTTATSLPVIFRTGVSYFLPWEIWGGYPLTAADVYYVTSSQLHFNLGIEIPVYHKIDLRAGYILGGDSYSFTTGFGIQYRKANIAYAFVPYQYDLGNSHRFSLIFNF